jgi:hypothetical protein
MAKKTKAKRPPLDPLEYIELPAFDAAGFFDSLDIPVRARAKIVERCRGSDTAELERAAFEWLADHGRPASSVRTPFVSSATLSELANRFARKPIGDSAVRNHLRRLDQTKTASSDGPWSTPDTPSRLAERFQVTAPTFKRWVKTGKIRAKKLSDRSYQVHVGDLPVPTCDHKLP